ncbi:MAG: undecaprenyldiphospho-muramoylpentapeptide beta-N-acetylglucosaminyltransferase, partial [Erysipelotrichaceae bacterium]|nr:undecaprenyldiphospho-muramoylpentapeptide beta-N-acetylglucosaminyltransferase [Erysipelotrichaceae bacterium]
SPYVPNNHQFINAKSMLDNGAAMLLEEKDLTPDTLIGMIDEVINDDDRLREMGEKARAMSHPNAAEDIVKLIYETVGMEYERTE